MTQTLASSQQPERRRNGERRKRRDSQKLSQSVTICMENYFKDLNGHSPGNLYEIILAEVEKPLLEAVLSETDNNITRSAEILGLNRGTLRKKLQKYALGK